MSEREKEFKKVKKVIKKNIKVAMCGLFSSNNVMGDPTINIFRGNFFTVDICLWYCYFDVTGMNNEEFEKLKKYYRELRGF